MASVPVPARVFNPTPTGSGGRRFIVAGWIVAAVLPLVGLVSLLAHEQIDPGWTSPEVHFSLFATVGGLCAGLALAAGEAARRRGDARVLLISLAFLSTGGFMAVHAIGTTGILFEDDYAGFKVAIPVGLLLASVFAAAAAFVDARPELPPAVVRHQALLRRAVFGAIVVWIVWTLTKAPPLTRPLSEGGTGSLLSWLAAIGVVIYGAAAIRFYYVFRDRLSLLPVSLIACFALLTEAMIGVAVTGERAWHASWWLWHFLIVIAYVLVGLAAHRQWRDERFRPLYLETTRERTSDATVLFTDLAGFTSFSERSTASEVAQMLNELHGAAMPLAWRRYGGTVEKLMGDGMLVSFGAHADQPDHALRAAEAALAMQEAVEELVAEHPDWPRLRAGVNTGDVVVREMGGDGFVAFELCGDTVNTASRLEGQAPVGGVLIGAGTYERLPTGADVEARFGLKVKGKDAGVDAYLLRALPSQSSAFAKAS